MENAKNFSRMDLPQMPCCHNSDRDSLCDKRSDYGCSFPSLAMVYPTEQHFDDLYDLEEALCRGTLFRKLDMPFEGSKRCMRGADVRCVR